MRRLRSKAGNDYFAVAAKKANGERYFSMYGVPIPALDNMLPSEAVVLNQTFALAPGLTQSGAPKVSGTTTITVENVQYRVTVNISLKQDGNWNLIAKAIPGGKGGGSSVQSLSDL